MSLIHILDEVTSNQIAAGEVVERPVNAVKELVENSIDAGARMIEVEIADGGMTYIRVTDDGSGMTREDAKLSVIRHATSKISSVENFAGRLCQVLCLYPERQLPQDGRKIWKEPLLM